ncbi:hypothetical protein HMPREF9176_0132 [Streptococcus downei F0415]|nr:hypothetical protein HMPREF9176_0132 [Streptococcus downei F0415]
MSGLKTVRMAVVTAIKQLFQMYFAIVTIVKLNMMLANGKAMRLRYKS